MSKVLRIPLEQTFANGPLVVSNVSPVQLSGLDLTSLITAILFSNQSANTNSVFWGGPQVSTTGGTEIAPGSAPLLVINQGRQLYELQDPAIKEAIGILCAPVDPISIPLIVWNPSHIYLIAATAPTTIGVTFFYNVYS
jgi:hypothetical protein